MGERVGIKLKTLRNAKRITLKELGGATGLSVSYLSQVERGVSSVNLDSLGKIADALNLPIDSLLDLPVERPEKYVIRTHEQKIDVEQSASYFCNRLCNDALENALMEPQIVNMLPGRKIERPVPGDCAREEFFYVIEGVVAFSVDGRRLLLGPGDSAHCEEGMSFEWENLTERMVRLLLVKAEMDLEIAQCGRSGRTPMHGGIGAPAEKS